MTSPLARRFLVIGVVFLVLLFLAGNAAGATARSQNFQVEAPTADTAQRCCDCAEQARKTVAVAWLGQEIKAWSRPCPVRVTVVPNEPRRTSSGGGATTFAFDKGRILDMTMSVEGPLDRLLAAVIPHEVTHAVLASHFRQPLPRWCDEGMAVNSEDEQEFQRHDRMCRDFLNQGRAMPLSRLFALTDYPDDVLVLYAEGFSVVHYLIQKGGRPRFLAFVTAGMREGWDKACVGAYGLSGTAALEAAWVAHLRSTKTTPHAAVPEVISPPQAAQPPRGPSPPDTQAVLGAVKASQDKILGLLTQLVENDRRQDARLDALEAGGASPTPPVLQPRTSPQSRSEGTITSIPGWSMPPQKSAIAVPGGGFSPVPAKNTAIPPPPGPAMCPPGRL